MAVTVTNRQSSGLFSTVDTIGVVRNVGLINPSVTSNAQAIGTLVGTNYGTISTSYASGGTVSVSGTVNVRIGGLVGLNNTGNIIASYATTSVNAGTQPDGSAGGLVGENRDTITASYATGTVTGTNTGSTLGESRLVLGGLVGEASYTSSTVINSYCDTQATGQANCIALLTRSATSTAAGYTTA